MVTEYGFWLAVDILGTVALAAAACLSLLVARRRIERLVADAGISDPTELDDERLAGAVELLTAEEHEVSAARADVIGVLDRLQDELKRRYKDDPTLALR